MPVTFHVEKKICMTYTYTLNISYSLPLPTLISVSTFIESLRTPRVGVSTVNEFLLQRGTEMYLYADGCPVFECASMSSEIQAKHLLKCLGLRWFYWRNYFCPGWPNIIIFLQKGRQVFKYQFMKICKLHLFLILSYY